MADHVACVAQSHERVIVTRRAAASIDLGIDVRDRTEENQRLIDQMGAEIEQLAAAPFRRGRVPPRLGVRRWPPALEA